MNDYKLENGKIYEQTEVNPLQKRAALQNKIDNFTLMIAQLTTEKSQLEAELAKLETVFDFSK